MNTKQIKNLCAASASVDGGERERDAPHIEWEKRGRTERRTERGQRGEGQSEKLCHNQVQQQTERNLQMPPLDEDDDDDQQQHRIAMIIVISLRLRLIMGDYKRSYDHSDRSMIMPFRSSLHAVAVAVA